MPDTNRIPILFILMEFPPVNTTGNYRNIKFIKYLTLEHNIKPIVITFCEKEAAELFNTYVDENLRNEIPKDLDVYRIQIQPKKIFISNRITDFFSIFFSIKDSLASRWFPFFSKEIKEIIRKHKPKAIYTSLPPFSSGMLSLQVSKQFKIPLIVDMRDLWSMFGYPLASWFHYYFTIVEEKRIFSHAKAIIVVTPQMVTTIRKVHPYINEEKIHLIYNGFDEILEKPTTFFFEKNKPKITIGYIGSFYYEPKVRNNVFKPRWKKKGHKKLEYIPVQIDWLYRSPYFLFKTLSCLFKNHPSLKEVIRVEFIGKKFSWLDQMIEKFELTDNVYLHGFVDRKKALELQQNFDIFLATSEKKIGGEHYCLPSKIFDYIGQNKPVLAFVTEGIQKEFFENSGLALICNPDETEESSDKIYRLITNGLNFKPNYEYLDDFHVSHLAKNLSDLITSAI